MTSATIKLFLPHGDAKRLRVGEVSNWTGKALAAPRTELDDLLIREEAESAGIYFLFGSDPKSATPQKELLCKNKGAVARGRRTEGGFVVFKDSTGVAAERPSAETQHPFVVALRKKLVQDGTLAEKDGFFIFAKDTEFDSPSAAAAVIHGGGANGPYRLERCDWQIAQGTRMTNGRWYDLR